MKEETHDLFNLSKLPEAKAREIKKKTFFSLSLFRHGLLVLPEALEAVEPYDDLPVWRHGSAAVRHLGAQGRVRERRAERPGRARPHYVVPRRRQVSYLQHR